MKGKVWWQKVRSHKRQYAQQKKAEKRLVKEQKRAFLMTSGHCDFDVLASLTERQRRSVREYLAKELKPGYMPKIVELMINNGQLDVDFC